MGRSSDCFRHCHPFFVQNHLKSLKVGQLDQIADRSTTLRVTGSLELCSGNIILQDHKASRYFFYQLDFVHGMCKEKKLRKRTRLSTTFILSLALEHMFFTLMEEVLFSLVKANFFLQEHSVLFGNVGLVSLLRPISRQQESGFSCGTLSCKGKVCL